MAEELVRYALHDRVAVLNIDDGKANALSPTLIAALHAGLDRAEREAGAVMLVGRPGRFSAGFDLSIMTSGLEGLRGLVKAGAELLLRTYLYPRPVVTACTGHALAAGALVLLASDLRVGARGQFKIGLNEVAIQLTLPVFGMEQARDRLAPCWFTAATTRGTPGSPKATSNCAENSRSYSEPTATADHEMPPPLTPVALGRRRFARRSGASVRRWSIACVRRSTRTSRR
jgi:enoyl-CoA hydratase